jgi:hypothetical protein
MTVGRIFYCAKVQTVVVELGYCDGTTNQVNGVAAALHVTPKVVPEETGAVLIQHATLELATGVTTAIGVPLTAA